MRRIKRLAMVLALAGVVTAALAAPALADEGSAGDEETRVCPGCGEVIPASSVFCPECKRYLPDAKIEGEKPRNERAKAKVIVAEPARRRWAGNVLAGGMAGSESTTVFGLWTNLGIRVADLTVLGPGVGYQSYKNGGSVPIYFGLRRYLSRSMVPGLVYFRLGYNKAWLKDVGFPFTGDEDPSGMFFGGGVGADFLSSNGAGFTLEFGGRAEITNMFYVFIYPGGRVSPVMKQQKTLALVRFAAGASF